MNFEEIYNKLKEKKYGKVVLQFTNEYLDKAKQLEKDFGMRFPETKFFIAADK